MTRYASRTTVSADNSRVEIERVLIRYGASAFGYMQDGGLTVIAFRMRGRHIKFLLPLPDPSERRFTHNSRGKRTPDLAQREWEQACRARWRALLLIVKAKLEAIESGVASFENEFLPQTLLPSGQTVGEWLGPQVELAYELAVMPLRLELPERSSQ